MKNGKIRPLAINTQELSAGDVGDDGDEGDDGDDDDDEDDGE